MTPGVTWGDSKRRRAGAAAVALAVALVAPATTSAHATAAGVPTGTPLSATGQYIVQALPGHLTEAVAAVRRAGGHYLADLSTVNGFTADLSADGVAAAQTAAGVLAVTPDAPVALQGAAYSATGDSASPQNLASLLGSTKYWQAGYYGQGIGVAILDSGVTPVNGFHHNLFYGPDLTPEGQDTQLRNLDTFGHGTFMASLIGARTDDATRPYVGNYSPTNFVGTAPEANIVSVKVADQLGNTQQSTIIKGIDW